MIWSLRHVLVLIWHHDTKKSALHLVPCRNSVTEYIIKQEQPYLWKMDLYKMGGGVWWSLDMHQLVMTIFIWCIACACRFICSPSVTRSISMCLSPVTVAMEVPCCDVLLVRETHLLLLKQNTQLIMQNTKPIMQKAQPIMQNTQPIMQNTKPMILLHQAHYTKGNGFELYVWRMV